MSVHNLYEYSFAKKVCEDVPTIIIQLEKAQTALYEYNHYKDVADVLWAINEAKIMLDIHFQVYNEIYNQKGEQLKETPKNEKK